MLRDCLIGSPTAYTGRRVHAGPKTVFRVAPLQYDTRTGWQVADRGAGKITPILTISYYLRCINGSQLIGGGNIALAGGIGGSCKSIHPTDVIPVVHVKGLRDHILALKCRQPLISWRARTATFRGIQLDYGRKFLA